MKSIATALLAIILIGALLQGLDSLYAGMFMSVSAGTFLYISATEIVVEEFSIQ